MQPLQSSPSEKAWTWMCAAGAQVISRDPTLSFRQGVAVQSLVKCYDVIKEFLVWFFFYLRTLTVAGCIF